jgi:hypothetical protein
MKQVSIFSGSSILKMEAICSSEISVDLPLTAWGYVPENRALHNHRCENLKSYIIDKGF